MSSSRLLLGFGSELVVFVVAAGGLALLLLERTASWRLRACAAPGFAALAVAAALRGADVVTGSGPVAGLRSAAFLLIGAGALAGADAPASALAAVPAFLGPAGAAVAGATLAGLR